MRVDSEGTPKYSASTRRIIEAAAGILKADQPLPRSGREVARIAGVDASQTRRVLKDPMVQKTLVEALDENGFSDIEIARRLQRFNDDTGLAMDFDNQLKSLTLVCKLKKHLAPPNSGTGALGGPISINLMMQKVQDERKARGLDAQIVDAEVVEADPPAGIAETDPLEDIGI